MKEQDAATGNNEVIAEAIFELAKAVRVLGLGNVDHDAFKCEGQPTAPGAIEGLGMLLRDSHERIAVELGDISEAIRELVCAIEERG